ncbi:MAG: putative ABC transporter permease [Clostridia bacterium]|nr:putative ABC transporter permease [Clostridia bacterium]
MITKRGLGMDKLDIDKKELINEIIIIFWVFIIGSVLGYVYEMIVVLFQKGFFESRQGLIYGPFTPVYGIGGIVYYLAFKIIKTRNKGLVFILTMILGGVTEYLASYIQEKAFGTISWDYSNLLFNINGRTSLLHCSYWGIAGILYVCYIEPLIKKVKSHINSVSLKIAFSILFTFMTFNILISCAAAQRQEERRNSIESDSKFDMFLDKYYPDEYMDKVYANKKNM